MVILFETRRRILAAAIAVAISGTLVPALASAEPAIAWAACTDAPQDDCGQLAVPLDYDQPAAGSIGLALERRKATDQTHKIGTLFLEPGGPGVSGRAAVRQAAGVFGSDVLARFDIVGFDPRGVSQSSPVQCFDTNEEFAAVLGSFVDVPLSKAEVDTDLADAKKYGEACGRHAGSIINHMSSLNVAKDLDRMRQAVGDSKLTYVGFSYGTLIGATYANLYPNKVRALVLDGPVDPAERTNQRIANKIVRAEGSDNSLNAFLTACQKAGTACPFFGGPLTAQQKFVKLRDRFRAGPVGTVTISDFTDNLIAALYYAAKLAPMAAQLQQLYDQAFGISVDKKSAAHEPWSGPHVDGAGYSFNTTDSYYSVNCVDGPMPRDQRLYPGLENRFEQAAPTFGRAELTNDLACPTWPVTTDERYAGPWNRWTSVPTLVIGQTHDPYTPYPMAQAMARELGNARLLTIDGYGHTSTGGVSACASGKRDAYLLTQKVPAATQCAQNPIFPDPAS
jgi:pimeloyl-ACP methyl ester carboxylesterase